MAGRFCGWFDDGVNVEKINPSRLTPRTWGKKFLSSAFSVILFSHDRNLIRDGAVGLWRALTFCK